MDRIGRGTGWRGGSLHHPSEVASVSPTGVVTPGLSPLGLSLAVAQKTVRWCTISNQEANKCSSFRENMSKAVKNGPLVSCVKKSSYLDCIKAIRVSPSCLKESGRKSMLFLSPVILK